MTAKPWVTTDILKGPTHKTNSTRWYSPGWLARWPIVGILMFIIGSLAFAGLTANLFNQGPLLEWDRYLANVLPSIALQSPAFVKDLMVAGFYMGKEVVAVLTILLGIFFLYQRSWQELAMAMIGWTGSSALFTILSAFFARARPPTQIWMIVSAPGYPSGHAIAVVVFYGLMAYLVVPKMPSLFWKVFVVAAAILIIGFVGFSRIFTAGHYLTDILAGYALGIAWSGIVYTSIEIFTKRIRRQHV